MNAKEQELERWIEDRHARRTAELAPGAQRLSIARLQQWKALQYGMFIHFGLKTFYPRPTSWPDWVRIVRETPEDPAMFQPEQLDVEQWMRTAQEAGMKYAILTTRHGNEFCLWPTQYTDKHAVNSPLRVDVVRLFVDACRKYGIVPCFYYAGGSSLKGGAMAPAGSSFSGWVTREFLDLVKGQLTELLTNYGEIGQVWLDGPGMYGSQGRHEIYDHIAALQPNAVISMNGAFLVTPGGYNRMTIGDYAWPTDVWVVEAGVPPEWGDWVELDAPVAGQSWWDGKVSRWYYLPVESACRLDMNVPDWFWNEGSMPRPDKHLLGLRLISLAHRVNLVLNVPPDRRGLLPEDMVEALMRLRENMIKLGYQ